MCDWQFCSYDTLNKSNDICYSNITVQPMSFCWYSSNNIVGINQTNFFCPFCCFFFFFLPLVFVGEQTAMFWYWFHEIFAHWLSSLLFLEFFSPLFRLNIANEMRKWIIELHKWYQVVYIVRQSQYVAQKLI